MLEISQVFLIKVFSNGGFPLGVKYRTRDFPFVLGALEWSQAEIYSILTRQLSRV